MLPFHEPVAADFTRVNDQIVRELHSEVELVENIGHYIIEAGGKRLRPLLVLLTANCLEYSGHKHIKLAAIIEFIHTATLLHDDVVDVSNLRRGRATANARWGNAPSVLVGDFLYSRAFQMLVQLGEMEIMRILSDTTNVISEGEVQQLVNAKNPSVTQASYFEVIYKKTAALFEAAGASAAVCAGAQSAEAQAAEQFGRHLGIAFQLVDDALDYDGEQASLGKNIGDDLAEGKPTLPLIYAMEHADACDAELIRHAIVGADSSALNDVVAIVRNSGALAYTTDCAAKEIAKAKQCLQAMPANRYRDAMSGLADFALARTF